ncbi:SGNH/GDSL hydrolase family protein [Reyranella sp.]|uniref:SGNH/GDSL hydrolase family protein n=1 Tax=Reyranella sp. TaxID=1929291 RepID=UPI003BAB58C9
MTTLFEYDPDLGYRFVPHLKTRVANDEGGYLVRTNGQGFRNDREFERDDPASRILVFGDSFTAGDGVSNGSRYTDVLEGLLSAAQVHNFGLPGSGTDVQYLCYRKVAAGAPATAIVMAVLVENIRRIVSPYRPSQTEDGKVEFLAKPYFELDGDRLELRHVPVPREPVTARELEGNDAVDRGGRFPMLRKLVRSMGLQEVVQQLTRYQPTPEYDSPDNPAWRLMRAILLAWRAEVPQPVVLMPLPLYQHVEGTADPPAYRQRFAELAREGGFVLHDPLDDLLAYDAQTRRSFRFKRDVHLTPAGHRAIAQSLAGTLRRLVGETAPATGRAV